MDNEYKRKKFREDPRSLALELEEQGAHIALMCLKYMNTDQVRDMLDTNELSPRFSPLMRFKVEVEWDLSGIEEDDEENIFIKGVLCGRKVVEVVCRHEDEIADTISDEHGWLVSGFEVLEVSEEE